MGLEIERRFIVKGDDWKEFIQSRKEFRQGYLIVNKDNWTVRIRIINNKEAYLTLKKPKEGITRYEFEYPVPLNDAEDLFKSVKYSIAKTRYELIVANQCWVVDCFQGENHPLVLAEIELKSADENIKKPNWCFKEVSNLEQWSNAALAKTPICSRPIAKKPNFL